MQYTIFDICISLLSAIGCPIVVYFVLQKVFSNLREQTKI